MGSGPMKILAVTFQNPAEMRWQSFIITTDQISCSSMGSRRQKTGFEEKSK